MLPVASVEARLRDLFRSIVPADDPLEEERRVAREDFTVFMERMYPGYVHGEHLDRLRDALTRVALGHCKRLIVTMPPRHSKSLHVSENFPAWYLGRNPDHRIIAASHTSRLAETFSRRVRNKMLEPAWPFPHVKVADDKGKVQAWDIAGSLSGGYAAVGVGGSPVGLGADLIIIDDPVRNQEDADSPVVREKTWEWFEGTLYTRRQPGAAIIVTATRWHEDDLTGRLLKRMDEGGEQWEHLHLPAMDDDGRYLWPEYWSIEEYEMAKLIVRVWNAQYMGRPSAKGGNILREEYFPYAPHGEPYHHIIQCWDCAEKPGVTKDYSVCVTIGVSPTHFDLLHVWRDRVPYPVLLQAAKDQATWVRMSYAGIPYTLIVEDQSAGTQLIQSLEAETRLPVVPEQPIGKNVKEMRAISITPMAVSRRLRILEGQAWRQEFINEITGFPFWEHDDQMDAYTIAIRYGAGIGEVSGASSRSYVTASDPVTANPYRRRPPTPRYPDARR